MRLPAAAAILLAGLLALVGSGTGYTKADDVDLNVQSLDGKGNNIERPDFGQAGTNHRRIADANYADGLNTPVEGPNARFVSNRVFNDLDQNVFSERDITQWGGAWGQFIASDVSLTDAGRDRQDIPFNRGDPLEGFRKVKGDLPFKRSRIAPGTGVINVAQHINEVSSFIDASAVYGVSGNRLEFLRAGPFDGKLRNNEAFLLLPGGQLPRRDARGNAGKAPGMLLEGRLRGKPDRAAVAGDVRANQNLALLSIQTLFAREHNRIVSRLPGSLSEEQKFQIARRVVIAEQQFVTYNEFLPALGVRLPEYRGYDPKVDATVSSEFATVGFRPHSMIHGELEVETEAARYSADDLKALKRNGVEVTRSEDRRDVEIQIPLNVGFFNPDLLPLVQLGPVLQGLGLEAQYQNDEMIDNQLRSVLFQIPSQRNPECLDGPDLAECFNGILDLGAIDIERGRDHGMPTYNDMREAFGLAARGSFDEITGEQDEEFPADQALTRGREIDDPDSLDFIELRDADGRRVEFGSEDAEDGVVTAVRRTPLAARLKEMYRSVDELDAFVGMLSEPRTPGTELGELQLAIWQRQFADLRDGDRFFFLNDPGLSAIQRELGIDFRQSLADLIAANTDVPRDDLNDNVFVAEEEAEEDEDADEEADDDEAQGGRRAGAGAGARPRSLSPESNRTSDMDVAADRPNGNPEAPGGAEPAVEAFGSGPRRAVRRR